jgi:hypothetical protein
MVVPFPILCMKWGTRYPSECVNRLQRALKRHTTAPYRLICFTDDPRGLDDGIEAAPLPPITLPEGLRWTPWRKLSIWQDPLLDGTHTPITGDALFLDIDLLIAGDLAPLFTYRPGEYCVIKNWTQPNERVGNTSVFRVPIGRYKQLFTRVQENPDEVWGRFRIEQQYLSANIPEQVFWPIEWCISFKHSCIPPFPKNWWQMPELPSTARIVAFHGKPDPEEALRGEWPAKWYKRFYKHVQPTPWIENLLR